MLLRVVSGETSGLLWGKKRFRVGTIRAQSLTGATLSLGFTTPRRFMLQVKKWAIPAVLGALLAHSPAAQSRELFEDEKIPNLAAGQAVYGDDTVGGYQVYAGNGMWQFEDADLSWSGGRADSIPLGVLRLTRWEGRELVAAQTIIANLRTNTGDYWSGSPCEGTHLLSRNRGRGRYDDCMTVGVESLGVGPTRETFLRVSTVQTHSSGRYYGASVFINVSYLGFPGSSPADWSMPTSRMDPAKADTLAQVGRWAERYQEAVSAQLDFRRPPDTFAAVPAFRTLRSPLAGPEAPPPGPAPRVPLVNGNSASYVFCESTKTMELEDAGNCPSL